MGWQLLVAMSLAALVSALVVVGTDPAARESCVDVWRAGQLRLGDRVAERLPEPWRRGLAARLVAAGAGPTGGFGAAVGLRVTSLLVAVGLVAMVGLAGAGRVGFIAGLGGALAVVAAPEVRLRRRIARRRASMARDLPRILDLLVISVEAGLGLDQALGRVVRAVPGALADEFGRLLTEVGAGVGRADALRGLAARCPVPELRSFTLAMVQAEAYGVSVGPLLRAQAEEIRTRHRQAAQMLAQKAPVKLLMPMVLCIFPALLVVVAGPALLSVRTLIAR